VDAAAHFVFGLLGWLLVDFKCQKTFDSFHVADGVFVYKYVFTPEDSTDGTA